ncbi:uncharacterized protein [Littorina saxatilis]
MTEWLDQYEKVAQRQQQYLQKIRDLRMRLRNKDERYMMLSIERMRRLPVELDHSPASPFQNKNADYKSHVPWSSSLLAHSYYPKMSAPSPRQVALVQSPEPLPSERGGSYGCVISGERLLPKLHPKYLSPISSRLHVRADRVEKQSKSDITLDRNKTDYEPIEDIAKRNRIQFSRYLSSRDDKDAEKDRKGKNSGSPVRDSRDVTGRLSIVANVGDEISQQDPT